MKKKKKKKKKKKEKGVGGKSEAGWQGIHLFAVVFEI